MSNPDRREIARAIASITGKPVVEDSEAMQVAKLLQGVLAGMAMKAISDPEMLFIKVSDVDIPTDEGGNYLDHFIITTGSGIRLRVDVTPES